MFPLRAGETNACASAPGRASAGRRLLQLAQHHRRLQARSHCIPRGDLHRVLSVFRFPLADRKPQDILPLAPLVLILVSGAIFVLFERFAGSRYLSLTLGVLTVAEIIVLFLIDPPGRRVMDEKIGMIFNVLRLTQKSDFVMDPKGETVFRRRAFYYVFEKITIRRLELGLINDDIPQRLIATRAPIATILRTPPRAHKFIEDNYLPVAWHLCVLGKMLGPQKENFATSYDIDLAIPARYTLCFDQGNFAAEIDGTPFSGARFLQAGHHEVQISAGAGRCALIWATAVEKGFSPFSPMAIDN